MDFGGRNTKTEYAKIMFTVCIFIFLIAAPVVSSAKRKNEKMRRIVRLTEYDNCKDRPRRSFHFIKNKISLPTKNVYNLIGDGFNDHAMRTVDKVLVNMSKCTDRSKTKCEHFRRLEWTSSPVVCNLIGSDSTPWASVTGAFQPRLQCPYRRGNFTVDMKPDFEALNQMDFAGNDYWIIQFEISNEQPWLCFHVEADFPRVRG